MLPPGKPGMADSYRVMQPCVLFDNGVYFMWYTADDSENRRVAYATSSDGLTWKRGGVVFDVSGGNYSQGAFAPAVVRTQNGFRCSSPATRSSPGSASRASMINADSQDGLTWNAGNIAFNAAGGTYGLRRLQRLAADDPQRSGRRHPSVQDVVRRQQSRRQRQLPRPDRARLPEATATPSRNGTRQPGPAGDPYYESVLTLGTQGTAFDTMKVADLRPVAKPAAAGTGLYGFYTGTNAADFVSRIGVKQSSDDGLTWTDAGTHATLIDKGPSGFDAGGVACPSPVVKGDASGWWVYHTSFDASAPGPSARSACTRSPATSSP